MTKSIMDLVAEAKSVVPDISPEEVKPLMGRQDVLSRRDQFGLARGKGGNRWTTRGCLPTPLKRRDKDSEKKN